MSHIVYFDLPAGEVAQRWWNEAFFGTLLWGRQVSTVWCGVSAAMLSYIGIAAGLQRVFERGILNQMLTAGSAGLRAHGGAKFGPANPTYAHVHSCVVCRPVVRVRAWCRAHNQHLCISRSHSCTPYRMDTVVLNERHLSCQSCMHHTLNYAITLHRTTTDTPQAQEVEALRSLKPQDLLDFAHAMLLGRATRRKAVIAVRGATAAAAAAGTGTGNGTAAAAATTAEVCAPGSASEHSSTTAPEPATAPATAEAAVAGGGYLAPGEAVVVVGDVAEFKRGCEVWPNVGGLYAAKRRMAEVAARM